MKSKPKHLMFHTFYYNVKILNYIFRSNFAFYISIFMNRAPIVHKVQQHFVHLSSCEGPIMTPFDDMIWKHFSLMNHPPMINILKRWILELCWLSSYVVVWMSHFSKLYNKFGINIRFNWILLLLFFCGNAKPCNSNG